MKMDITTFEDVKQMVDRFYDKVNHDAVIGPIFNETAQVNWDTHLPVMYSFWSSILLDAKTYRGQPFPKHMPLPIGKAHFTRWLELFNETIAENFEGPNSEHALYRANLIAQVFQSKLSMLKNPMFPMTEAKA